MLKIKDYAWRGEACLAWPVEARLGRAWQGGARRGKARPGKARQEKLHKLKKGEGVKMKTCIVKLHSVTPYSQSKFHNTAKLEKESADDYERRTWREKLNVMPDDFVYIPPMAFKNCLSEAAKYLGMKIPGMGQNQYTKHFVSGVMVHDPLVLPIKKKDVLHEWLFVPSDGKRGGGKRVQKCFPVIPSWSGEVIFHILDDTITESVFSYHLAQAGRFIGIGRWRPTSNGMYGRFKIDSEIVFE